MSRATSIIAVSRWSRAPFLKADRVAPTTRWSLVPTPPPMETQPRHPSPPSSPSVARTSLRINSIVCCQSHVAPRVMSCRRVSMFGSKNRGTVIAKGLKIVGTVTAEGLVEVNGQVDGELHCTSLIISRGAHVSGTIAAGRVVVDGRVEGPLQGGDVILKSQAHVVGDIHHQSLSIES